MLLAGHLAKIQGLKGEFLFHALMDRPERLEGMLVRIRGTFTVVDRAPPDSRGHWYAARQCTPPTPRHERAQARRRAVQAGRVRR